MPDSLRQSWIAEITVENWTSADHTLAIEGYIAIAPGKAAGIDRPIAMLALCPKCGNPMAYRPRTLSKPRTYRAFAVCEPCNVAAEF